MVAFEVITSGQTFVTDGGSLGRWAVYGFIIVTAIHAALVYLHHGTSPDIHEKINVGIARGEITTEAIRQATQSLEVQKAQLAESIHSTIVDQVKRDLGISVAVDPSIGFVPADPRQYAPLPYPVQAKPKKQSWFDRMRGTIKPAPTMRQNEQTVVQTVELQEQPEPKPQEDIDQIVNPWDIVDRRKEDGKPAGDAPFPG
jgi:hypothetical protein